MKHSPALASLLVILVAASGSACGSIERAGSDDGDPGDDVGEGGDDVGDDPGEGGDAAADGDAADDEGDAADDDASDGDAADDDGDAADDGAPGPTELCQGVSGSRLRQVIRRSDDGTSEQIALRDTQTGGDCTFQLDREGTLRCWPRLDGRPFGIGQRYFGHVSESAYACNDRYRVRSLGAQLAGPYYQDTTDGCVQASASSIFFAVVETIDPATFAPLAAERVPVGGRLERIDMVGDGVRARLPEWFDTELGLTCAFRLTADGAVRCVPGGVEAPQANARTFYRDADCGGGVELAIYAEPCDGAPTPTFVVGDPATACACSASASRRPGRCTRIRAASAARSRRRRTSSRSAPRSR